MSLPPKTTETSEDPLTVSEVRSRVLQPAEKYGEFPGNNTLEFLIPYSTVQYGKDSREISELHLRRSSGVSPQYVPPAAEALRGRRRWTYFEKGFRRKVLHCPLAQINCDLS